MIRSLKFITFITSANQADKIISNPKVFDAAKENMIRLNNDLIEYDLEVFNKKVIFKKKILPGERLTIETNVLNWKRGIGKFQGSAFVNKKLVCEAIFTLILPDEFYKYSVRNK